MEWWSDCSDKCGMNSAAKLWIVLVKLCEVLIKPDIIGLSVCLSSTLGFLQAYAVHVKLHTAPGNYIQCLSNLQTTVCPSV